MKLFDLKIHGIPRYSGTLTNDITVNFKGHLRVAFFYVAHLVLNSFYNKSKIMNISRILLLTAFVWWISACSDHPEMELADNAFIVRVMGKQKCSGTLGNFNKADFERLKKFTNVDDVSANPIGLINLKGEYTEGQQLLVHIRKLVGDENRPCTGDVTRYPEVWVSAEQRR